MVEIDVATLALLGGTIIPLLVGVVTKLNASSKTKAIINLVLSLGTGAVAFLTQNSGRSSWKELATAVVMAYLSSGVSYQNLWKPSGVGQAVQNATANLGIGGPNLEKLAIAKYDLLPGTRMAAPECVEDLVTPDHRLSPQPEKAVAEKTHKNTKKKAQ